MAHGWWKPLAYVAAVVSDPPQRPVVPRSERTQQLGQRFAWEWPCIEYEEERHFIAQHSCWWLEVSNRSCGKTVGQTRDSIVCRLYVRL